MRTHYAGKIDTSLVGKPVTVCGWIHRIRNLGGISFIDLRDISGIVQIVIDPEQHHLAELAKSLRNEFVLCATGEVRARPAGIANLELKTGAIEIAVTHIEILNAAEPLPFPLNETLQTANEDLRLRYRYLDLRRTALSQNLILRAKATQIMRNFLAAQNFIEIETPILTKSTPEGARDYLVPSRVHRGEFYALPQSPQIFKQLLMVAGLDKYYQIARCFRDEDLRADRQPEFTQIDIEMSFVRAETIQGIFEDLICLLWQDILGVTLPKPFPRLSYQEAETRYGSDKPDLRFGLELIEIKDLLVTSEFTNFADAANATAGRVVALCVPNGNRLSRKQLDGYAELVRIYGLQALGYLKVNEKSAGLSGLQSSLLKFFTSETIGIILTRAAANDGDLIFFGASPNGKTVTSAMGALRLKLAKDLNLIPAHSWSPLWITAFPMFEKTKEDMWTSTHHPFTAPINPDPAALLAHPQTALAEAYDLVINGIELGGGSMRIFKAEMQKAVFSLLGIDATIAEQQFGHLLNALRYGCPPHGGIALGLDRLIMLLAGAESLREVIAFPKTQNANCLMTEAPSRVSNLQLSELHLQIESSA